MKKFLVLAIMILMLAAARQANAGYTVKNQITKVFGTGQIYTGTCVLKSSNLCSSTAGDYVEVFDAIGSQGTTNEELKFEIGISANNGSQPGPDMGVDGVGFSQGIYIVTKSNIGALTTIVYDY